MGPRAVGAWISVSSLDFSRNKAQKGMTLDFGFELAFGRLKRAPSVDGRSLPGGEHVA